MNNSKILLLFLGVVLAGGTLLSWRQYAELVELRAAVMNDDERLEWQRKVQELEKLNREKQEQFVAVQSAMPQGTPAAGGRRAPSERGEEANAADGGSDAAREKARSARQQAAAIKELMTKPEVQAIMTLQKKAAIEQRYADLFKKLNLPPEQIQKLAALLEERANTMSDLITVARDQGINLRGNPEAYRKLVTETQNQLNDGIKAAIGDSGFAQLTNFERTIPQRNLVSDLEHRLSYTQVPLSPAQAAQLVQVLAANPSPRPAAATASGQSGAATANAGAIVRYAMTSVPGVGQLLGATDDTGRTAVPGYPISQAALDQAQAFLSPPQLAALQSLQRQQQAQQEMKNLVVETLVKNQPPPAATVTGRKGD